MHKEIDNIRKKKKKKKKKNLFTVALNFSAYTLLHRVVQCIFSTNTREQKTKNKSVQMKQKGKLKYTSNMRSQNEVIQVRCVELKLKVNNNNNDNNKNNNNNRRRERRSTGTKPQRKSWFILLSYWSPPKLLGRVSSHQWFPPFSTGHLDMWSPW